MTYYECDGCGQLATFVDTQRSQFARECPVCEERTQWAVAFSEEGVSY
jgi:transcription elongation factor Elf1